MMRMKSEYTRFTVEATAGAPRPFGCMQVERLNPTPGENLVRSPMRVVGEQAIKNANLIGDEGAKGDADET